MLPSLALVTALLNQYTFPVSKLFECSPFFHFILQNSEPVYIKSVATCLLVSMLPMNRGIACILSMSCFSKFLYTSGVICLK